MKMSSLKLYAALIPGLLSIFALIFAFSTSSKVPIRITLTAPYFEFMVEINSDKPPSHLNLLPDVEEMLVTSSGQ